MQWAHRVSRAPTSSLIMASVWNGEGVKRRRSVPRGTVGKGCFRNDAVAADGVHARADLSGRPTTSMTYNAVNIGRNVALSKSLGLNQDPRKWSLDQRQKDLRVRAWWGVLIHDWWYVPTDLRIF